MSSSIVDANSEVICFIPHLAWLQLCVPQQTKARIKLPCVRERSVVSHVLEANIV